MTSPETGSGDVAKQLLSHPRWELAPVKGLQTAIEGLPTAATAAMSCFAVSDGFDTTLATCRALTARGHAVTPHLPARSIRDSAHLHDLLQALKDSDVRDLFVVAGNTSKAVGPYDAVDLLEPARAAGFTAGIAAYPEGHPFLTKREEVGLLQRKQELASYLITQTCFNPATIARWLRSMRQSGVTLPAFIGVAGVVQRKDLIRMAAWMGVGKSMRLINRQRKLAAKLVGPSTYDPSHVLDGLIAAQTHEDLGVEGIHINTFNAVTATRTWWEDYETQWLAL